MTVAVLGLGNVLMADDGAGPAALAELARRYRIPETVARLDGGVLGLHLVGLLAEADSVLVLDAVRAGQPAGELVRLSGPQVHARFAARMSPHEVGFGEVLATARVGGREPRHLVVWGIEPERIEPGVGLSAAVAAGLDRLVAAAAEELRGWGVDVAVRSDPRPARPYPDDVLPLAAAGQER